MKLAYGCNITLGEGWFDAPYVRSLLDTESPGRVKDIEGPESDALLDYAGWSFIEDPLHVALLDSQSRTLAIAWIAATTRGLNLTYIVAESAQGNGWATLAVARTIVAYGERRANYLSKPGLTVHAQYEQENHASGRVAGRLGLLPAHDLDFEVATKSGARQFLGSEAAWSLVYRYAQKILSAE